MKRMTISLSPTAPGAPSGQSRSPGHGHRLGNCTVETRPWPTAPPATGRAPDHARYSRTVSYGTMSTTLRASQSPGTSPRLGRGRTERSCRSRVAQRVAIDRVYKSWMEDRILRPLQSCFDKISRVIVACLRISSHRGSSIRSTGLINP